MQRQTKLPSAEIEAAVLGANQVHQALCAPSSQRVGRFEIASSVVPAHYVSGDFIMSFQQGDVSFVVLGDLLGKGLSAAMWLTHTLDLVRRACEPDDGLANIMSRLNREMHLSRIGVPLTAMFLARLEQNETHVEYACGGCPSAFVLRGNRQVAVLEHGGPLLGALENARYNSGTLELEPMDTLVAVSDGVIEIHQGHDFELRPDRVVHHLQNSPGSSASQIVSSLTERVKQLSFHDDVSVLAIQRVMGSTKEDL